MRIGRLTPRLGGALLVVALVTALLATSLAPPSATDVGAVAAPLQAGELTDVIEDETDAREALIVFQDAELVPAELVALESGDEIAVQTGSIGSADLGVGQTITLLRPAGRRDIDIAVGEGLAFTGFRTTVAVPSAVNEVYLEIAIGDETAFSAVIAGGTREQLEVDLATPVVTDTVLSVSVEERFGGTCTSTAVEPAAVQLVDNEFYFEQLDNRPQTIADFFPPALEHVIVLMDPEASSSIRSAAFELSTALARRYPKMPSVDVVHRAVAAGPFAERASAAVPVSDQLFTRTVVLTEAEEAAMTIRQGRDGTYLEIAGPDGLVEEMAAAVSTAELAFVTKASVAVEDLATLSVENDLLGQRSLRDVGVRRLVASSSRVLQLPIVLPQAAFGEPVSEIRVRIGGLAIASGLVGSKPVVTLWLNDDLQETIEYDDSGRFDIEFVIDPSMIRRDNVLTVRSEVALECGDPLPTHELTLDAASWVDAEPGQALPVSLDRFPQVAIGHLAVAAGNSENEMELAMVMVGVLQGSSPLPIHPQAAAIERVLAGFSPGLVVTDGQGEVASAMARDLTTVRSEELAFVSSDRPSDLAFLSTSITETDQDVLVVFSPTEPLSRVFADHARDSGWWSFGGNAVGVRGDGDVVRSDTSVAAAAEAAAGLETLQPPVEDSVSIARQMTTGGLAALLLALGLFMARHVLAALRHLR